MQHLIRALLKPEYTLLLFLMEFVTKEEDNAYQTNILQSKPQFSLTHNFQPLTLDVNPKIQTYDLKVGGKYFTSNRIIKLICNFNAV